MYDIGIIGGGTAGMTAAIYGQRAGKRTIIIEGGTFGGQITSSPNVENYARSGNETRRRDTDGAGDGNS